MLDYTLQACKPCSCPALRLKKEPRDSDRDINGFLDRGSYTKGPGVTPHCAWQKASRYENNLPNLGEKEATIYRGN